MAKKNLTLVLFFTTKNACTEKSYCARSGPFSHVLSHMYTILYETDLSQLGHFIKKIIKMFFFIMNLGDSNVGSEACW